MNTSSTDMSFGRSEAPLATRATEECLAFWREVLGEAEEGLGEVCSGAERACNRDTVYQCRVAGRLAGTTHLTISMADPGLGGLGEVATRPDARRKGIAGKLCRMARDEFAALGGEALFLGTGNPDAARIYRRCGWLKLAGANVMALIATGGSPEAFLARRFEEPGPVDTVDGSAAHRIPMIPLIVSPHPWQVMDTTTNILSTRYAVQRSCMGLYPRYARLLTEGSGAWFAARTQQGRLVGLATARPNGAGDCQVDGFTHAGVMDAWHKLMRKPLEWAAERGASTCFARVSVEDEEKRDGFLALGFREDGVGEPFLVGERTLPSVRLVKT